MPPPPPSPANLDRDAIVARAFALYVRRGRQPGHEQADWFDAEKQLRAEADALAKAKSAPKSPAIVPPAAKSAATHVPAVLAAPAPKAAVPPAAAAPPKVATPPKVVAPPPPPNKGGGKNKSGKRK